jgi:hypothetical protein
VPENFSVNFLVGGGVIFPSTIHIHKLINKVTYTGSLLDKKHVKKCCVLIKEKINETGIRLEYSPQQPSLKQTAQETGI